ncbi:MAG: flagellar filament capping protein FliD [Planctomycetes bacterium]|jgi:flagellar hook-associated protein 2|nr:flagellar filament capping protein FliD [Planctomycetota bacterium]
MSSAGISFGGLASGLDTKAIISALVGVEERPIRALQTKKTAINKQKSLYGDLRGLLDKLSTAAKALKTTNDFLAMKTKSDDENVMTATASSTAVPGTYTAKVKTLAKAQVNSSTGSPSSTASLGGPASLQLEVGGNTYLIGVASPTLDSIAAAINEFDNQNESGVRAEVVDTGNTAANGANRYQLVVRSTQLGTQGRFTLSVDDGDAAFANVINNVAANTRTIGTDAELVLNGGISVFRSSNTISDLWPGITLDLKSEQFPTKDVTITVTTDAEATSKKVQDYVDAYNKVVDFFTEQNALDSEGKAKSPLFGDQTLRSLRSTLRTAVGASVTGSGNPAFQMLSQAGITSDTAGKLTFNRTKFEEALVDDENAVARIFTDPAKGVASTILDKIEVYTDSVDGLIKNRNETFDRQVKQTQSRIENAERRLTIYQKQLEAKYASLENLLGKLQSQGSAVGNIGRR